MNTMPLIFYTHPMSRGRIVRWMLEEIGEPYETRLLEYGGSMKAPEYLAINPMGKVPAIQHGEAIVTETAAILTYLADAFPGAGLAPALNNHPARAAYHRWMFFTSGPLEAAVTDQSLGIAVPAQKQGFVGYGSLANVLQVLESSLKNRACVAGEQFSAADILLASSLAFYTAFGSIPANPVFAAYIARHKARPAAKRAENTDNALLPQSTS